MSGKERNSYPPNLVSLFTDASAGKDGAGAGWWLVKEGKSSHGFAPAPDWLGPSDSGRINEFELWGLCLGLMEIRARYGDGLIIVAACDNLAALAALQLCGGKFAKSSRIRSNPPRRVSVTISRLVGEAARLTKGSTLYLKHVKGHSNKDGARSHVNRKTDSLARKAARCRKRKKKS